MTHQRSEVIECCCCVCWYLCNSMRMTMQFIEYDSTSIQAVEESIHQSVCYFWNYCCLWPFARLEWKSNIINKDISPVRPRSDVNRSRRGQLYMQLSWKRHENRLLFSLIARCSRSAYLTYEGRRPHNSRKVYHRLFTWIDSWIENLPYFSPTQKTRPDYSNPLRHCRSADTRRWGPVRRNTKNWRHFWNQSKS